jgi:hypothetical protein
MILTLTYTNLLIKKIRYQWIVRGWLDRRNLKGDNASNVIVKKDLEEQELELSSSHFWQLRENLLEVK